MNDMEYLLQDPRPYIVQDSKLWITLFKLIVVRYKAEQGTPLLLRMWSYRSLGTSIQILSEGIKLVPLLHPVGIWESQQEFDEYAKKFLTPYAKEIKKLLREVVENEQTRGNG